jgi:hypothetical protein
MDWLMVQFLRDLGWSFDDGMVWKMVVVMAAHATNFFYTPQVVLGGLNANRSDGGVLSTAWMRVQSSGFPAVAECK